MASTTVSKEKLTLFRNFMSEMRDGTWLDLSRDELADLATLTLGLVEAKIEIDASQEEKPAAKRQSRKVEKSGTTVETSNAPDGKTLVVGRRYRIRGSEKWEGVVVEFVGDSKKDPEEKCSVRVVEGNDSFPTGKQFGGIPKRALVAYRSPRKSAA